MGSLIPLHHLSIGSSGQVRKLTANGSTRRRMLDLGLIQGTRVEALQKPFRGPNCL